MDAVVERECRVGVGLAAVGRPAYITSGRAHDLGDARDVDALRARSWQVLDAAYDGGVRYLDVARSYGRAEEFLADWLDHRAASGRPADDAEVGSKWGYRYVGQWQVDADVHEVKDHSLAAFTEQVAQTRYLLGDRLAVYHVHSATLETGVLADAALHRALAGLRDEGVRIGISTSGPGQAATVRTALDVTVDGVPLFTSVQTTWNLLEPSAGPALAEAAAAGARVIVKEVVANGRLAPLPDGDDDPDAGPAATTGGMSDGERLVRATAAGLGVPVDRVAYAAALAQPWAWRVLSGGATPEQVASHLAAVDVVLPDGMLDHLAGAAEPAEDYWAARSARPWR